MSRAEYMRTHLKYLSSDIRSLYQIDGLIAKDGYFYINITKGMYFLKQSDIIVYKKLISNMENDGYYPVPFTTGLWTHQIFFRCLCVDDFGVKYFSKDDVDHLYQISQKALCNLDRLGGSYLPWIDNSL